MFNSNNRIYQHIPGLFEVSIFKLSKQHKHFIKKRNPNLCECSGCGNKLKRITSLGLNIIQHHTGGVQTIGGIICPKCAKEPEAAINNALEDLCKRTGQPLEIYASWGV